MHPSDERKVLEQLLKEIDSPGKASSGWSDVPAWISIAVITASCFHFFGRPSLPHALLMAGFFLAGLVYAQVRLRRKSARNWPTLRPFLDRTRVEARLREILLAGY